MLFRSNEPRISVLARSSTTGGNPRSKGALITPHHGVPALYVGHVHDGDEDHNIDGLLEGLEGTARTERIELVKWLFEQGITMEEIRATNPPLLLATRHIIGDDGTYVSTREISEAHGIDLGLLQRVQRAIGLVRVDDPDAVVHMRADRKSVV